MKLENNIISYLMKFGNTREDDLINFGVNRLGCSLGDMKRILKCMVFREKAHWLVHDELEPPKAYLSLTEPVLHEHVRTLIELNTLKYDFSEEIKNMTSEICG
jgi:hypothetical protein